MRFLLDENVHRDIATELRQSNYEILTIYEVGLAGHKDHEIIEYSEKNDLILLTGDKDFGGLIEFGKLWGRGKVMLLRYHLINIKRMVTDIIEVINRESETLAMAAPVVIVISEGGYRIHRPSSE